MYLINIYINYIIYSYNKKHILCVVTYEIIINLSSFFLKKKKKKEIKTYFFNLNL